MTSESNEVSVLRRIYETTDDGKARSGNISSLEDLISSLSRALYLEADHLSQDLLDDLVVAADPKTPGVILFQEFLTMVNTYRVWEEEDSKQEEAINTNISDDNRKKVSVVESGPSDRVRERNAPASRAAAGSEASEPPSRDPRTPRSSKSRLKVFNSLLLSDPGVAHSTIQFLARGDTEADSGSCMLVIKGMKAHPTHVGIQENSCKAISIIMRTVGGGEQLSDFEAAELCIPLILSAMRAFPDNTAIQSNACEALDSLATADDIRSYMVAEAALTRILEAVAIHLSDEKLSLHAVSLLENLSRAGVNKPMISRSKAVARIVEIMGMHTIEIDIQRKSIETLLNITPEDDRIGTTCEAMFKAGAIPTLSRVIVLHRDVEDFQENVAFLLCRLVTHSEGHRTLLCTSESVRMLLSIIAQHRTNETINADLMNVLGNICNGRDMQSTLYSEGAVNQILTSLVVHSKKSPSVLEQAGLLLWKFMEGNDEVRASIQASKTGDGCVKTLNGVLKDFIKFRNVLLNVSKCFWHLHVRDATGDAIVSNLLSVIRSYGTDADVMDNVLGALYNLFRGDAQVKTSVVTCIGAIPRLLDTMRTHPKQSKIQMFGCATLREIVYENSENKSFLFKEGGINVVLNAMKQHIANADVQTFACLAVDSLSVEKVCRETIGDGGGIDLIISAMKAHRRNRAVETAAMGALRNLSYNKANATFLVESEGIATISATMKDFASFLPLQRAAVGIFENIGASTLLLHHDALVKEGALKAAVASMKAHREDIQLQDRACGLFRNVLRAASDAVRQACIDADCLPSIVVAMDIHRTIENIQESGVAALWGLASVFDCRCTSSGEVQTSFIGLSDEERKWENSKGFVNSRPELRKLWGCIPLVLDIMDLHESNGVIQFQCLSLLKHIVFLTDRSETVVSRIVSNCVAAMNSFTDLVDLLEAASALLWMIAKLDSIQPLARRSTSLCNEDTVWTVLKTMYTCADFVTIQECCVGIIWVINSRTSDVVLDYSGERVVPAVIQAMKSFPDSVLLQLYACLCLQCLAKNESTIRAMAKDNVCQSLAVVLRSFATNERVQLAAIEALRNFTILTENQELIVDIGVIPMCLRSMKAFPFDEKLQDAACSLIRNVSRSDKNRNILASNEDVLLSIIDAIKRFPTAASLHEHANSALWNMCANCEDQKLVMTRERVSSFILRSLENHIQNPLVVQAACGALYSLCQENRDQRFLLCHDNAITLLVRVMRVHNDDAVVQRQCVALLYVLSVDNESKQIISLEGAIPIIASAMRAFVIDEEIQRYGAACFRHLSFENSHNQMLIPLESANDLLAVAMTNHMTSVELLTHCLSCIKNLCIENEKNRANFARSDVVAVILTCLRQHIASSEVVTRHAIAALWSLSLNLQDSQDILANCDAASVVLQGMRKHGDSRSVAEYSTYLLWNIYANPTGRNVSIVRDAVLVVLKVMHTHNNSDLTQQFGAALLSRFLEMSPPLKALITEKGGVELLINAMTVHPLKALVQEQVCAALSDLSSQNADNQISISNLGGVQLIIKAMKAHDINAAVQSNACRALQNLIFKTINQVIINRQGGVTLILKALKGHLDSLDVQFCGMRLLSSLCTINSDIRAQVTRSGAVSRFVDAMRTYPESEELQQEGFTALYTIVASHPDTASLVVDVGGITTFKTFIHQRAQSMGGNSEIQSKAASVLAVCGL